ncbi:aldo/keto reductase [Alicyclobacillus cycloheptanicus]|jgi:aryl-alcohol dehydrogenase-like predicted oxidoreductase|uniref:Aryl-alcohol dehydrogenase-like predicted oxidoreductase n=1 Tax=Alicyclobacillus cycloheptanicus TaxID=1457 RepID=A0ABT9XIX4_9BACL|nr:aldo/keto reductase [Alicyclobacillus cycloheptanicus]MDQ0190251.1 aryl-alcohol dehydrogenase-like predicted oxidoreductase [Alicyclobacillus cycloheptanicus]
MEYRNLGSSGLKVSVVGLGTNAFGKRADKESSIRVIHASLDAGVNFIDTANIYTGTLSESIIGEAIEGRRHEVVLATKAGLVAGEGPNERGSSRVHLMREVEASLRRLRTDYIDLYQIHTFDPYTPLEETLRTLDDLVRAGKVRYIGASNYAAWQLMKALGISDRLGLTRYVSIQPSYSLADRTPELELVPLCLDQGIGLIPYFPLAGGILTGKYSGPSNPPAGSRADKDPNFAKRLKEEQYMTLAAQVNQAAQEMGVTPSALSLAWLMHQPAVSTVIVGATKVEQVEQNVQSADLHLDDETLARLDEMTAHFKYGPPFSYARLP